MLRLIALRAVRALGTFTMRIKHYISGSKPWSRALNKEIMPNHLDIYRDLIAGVRENLNVMKHNWSLPFTGSEKTFMNSPVFSFNSNVFLIFLFCPFVKKWKNIFIWFLNDGLNICSVLQKLKVTNYSCKHKHKETNYSCKHKHTGNYILKMKYTFFQDC